MKYLLTLLLVMIMEAPVYAFDPYEDVDQQVAAAKAHVKKLTQNLNLSKEEQIFVLSECFVDMVRKEKVSYNYVDWFIEGIKKAVGACPLKVQDSIPPNMENADIPEYLVNQLKNINAMKRTQDEVTGTKPGPVLYIGLKLTLEELRRLSSRDDMINLIFNNESRLFFQVEK